MNKRTCSLFLVFLIIGNVAVSMASEAQRSADENELDRLVSWLFRTDEAVSHHDQLSKAIEENNEANFFWGGSTSAAPAAPVAPIPVAPVATPAAPATPAAGGSALNAFAHVLDGVVVKGDDGAYNINISALVKNALGPIAKLAAQLLKQPYLEGIILSKGNDLIGPITAKVVAFLQGLISKLPIIGNFIHISKLNIQEPEVYLQEIQDMIQNLVLESVAEAQIIAYQN
eukprot:gene8431-9917_t